MCAYKWQWWRPGTWQAVRLLRRGSSCRRWLSWHCAASWSPALWRDDTQRCSGRRSWWWAWRWRWTCCSSRWTSPSCTARRQRARSPSGSWRSGRVVCWWPRRLPGPGWRCRCWLRSSFLYTCKKTGRAPATFRYQQEHQEDCTWHSYRISFTLSLFVLVLLCVFVFI